MSLIHAMKFMEIVYEDDSLKEAIDSKGLNVSLEDVTAIAAERGFLFSVAELREAFAKDWLARYSLFTRNSDQ